MWLYNKNLTELQLYDYGHNKIWALINFFILAART